MYETSKKFPLFQVAPGAYTRDSIFNEEEVLSDDTYLRSRLSIEGAPGSLIDRVLQEFRFGDLYLGNTLKNLSPLAPAGRTSVEEIQSSIPTTDVLDSRNLPQEQMARLKVLGNGNSWRTPEFELSLDEDGEPVTVAAFAPDAFVMVIPSDSMIIDITYLPEDESGNVLDGWPPHVRDDDFPNDGSLIVWRHYVGSHSASMDGFTARGPLPRRRRISLNPIESVTLLVGRALSLRASRRKRTSHDPSWRLRRWWKERRTTMMSSAPSIESVNASEVADGAAVVAIHGTMSCGVKLAGDIQDAISSSKPNRIMPVLRFEHDTWHSVSHNAADLLQKVQNLNLRRVLFVAHSRGGLVGAEVLERLQAHLSHGELISLGTPFGGTPIADAAGEAFLASFAVMDQLEIDIFTRLFGLLYLGRIPDGIADMQTESGYIRASSFRPLANSTGAGGAVDFQSSIRQCGLSWIWRSAIRGVALGAIGDGNNDLVVPQASALTRVGETIELACDHFCYLDEVEVRDAIASAHQRLL